MAGKKGLKKRIWSDDEKRTICAQTLTPGVSVAQVCPPLFDEREPDFQMAEGPPVCA